MSYKATFAIAVALDPEIKQMDVKTAFLYWNINEEVWIEEPDYDEGTGRNCRLKKALYGLKQSPRIWYTALSEFLASLGFVLLESDVGVFVNGNTSIAVYVDDLLIVGPDKQKISEIKKKLLDRF